MSVLFCTKLFLEHTRYASAGSLHSSAEETFHDGKRGKPGMPSRARRPSPMMSATVS